ncbi:zinc metalloprotease HtpX [Aquibium oceanicum]|uniref:Peptidase M48 Ste24p n=1 Tax=Aquibium oceanicum TaxID=1670800 RepID=A0A1L3SLN9_9HYPH|nr:zinc metalloprotease HtpX [Aquibium oceanicum]APH70318.1 peptidase M48 Ste24p [Aquibium oceanicum]
MNATPDLDLFEQRRHRAMNTLHTWLLGAGSLLLLAVTAFVFAGGTGVVYALVFGAVSMWMVRRVSPKMVLSMYNARPLTRREFPEGVALVEELARRADLPSVPVLHVVPSKLMNAFAVGRREESAIAVTDALVRRMTARELAGVLAHEISHIANEDVKVMAFADMVSRFTSIMSTVGIFTLVLNVLGFAGGYEAQVPWPAVLILIASPTIGGLLQLALSRTREYDADLNAAILTGDPDGLASALLKLERAQRRIWEGLVLPGSRMPDASVLRSHPITEERIRRLMALKSARGLREPSHLAEAVSQPPRPRRSFIPDAGRARRPVDYHRIASLMAADHPVPTERHDSPSHDGPLAEPDGPPRLRIRRGGLWW